LRGGGQLPWCLSCCFWYTIVLQDVAS
jgi:hypothetical protein